MSFVNYHTKNIHFKVIYYGPEVSGKTTCMEYIYKNAHTKKTETLTSFNSDPRGGLFFDFLPLDMGRAQGFKNRVHLYSLPGKKFFKNITSTLLKGLDGVIFVADSQIERMQDNLNSFQELTQHLDSMAIDMKKLPFIFQWNKRDLPNITPCHFLREKLNTFNFPEIETVADQGEGVLQGLEKITELLLLNARVNLQQH